MTAHTTGHRKQNTMKKLVPLALAALLLAGCGNNFRDVENIDSQDADEYTVWNNVDQHPNIVRVCADGLAFVTTTRDYTSVQRVPEWDQHCADVTR